MPLYVEYVLDVNKRVPVMDRGYSDEEPLMLVSYDPPVVRIRCAPAYTDRGECVAIRLFHDVFNHVREAGSLDPGWLAELLSRYGLRPVIRDGRVYYSGRPRYARARSQAARRLARLLGRH